MARGPNRAARSPRSPRPRSPWPSRAGTTPPSGSCAPTAPAAPTNSSAASPITEAPTSIENAYPLLTKPGQWYLDPAAHEVYYIPRGGENLATADVEAANLQTLLSIHGSASAPIHNIGFQGIQFSYATDTTPNTPAGFSEIQATYTITGDTGYKTQGLCTFVSGGTCPYGNWTKMPGNVSLGYDTGIHFDHDYFVHLGAAGLDLGDGSQGDTVTACVFTDISGNGLDVGGVDANEPSSAQQTTGNVVKDSHFTNIAAEYQGGVAIDVGYVATSTFQNNQIDHVPYSGISVGWGGWPDKVKLPAEPNYSHGNAFTDNLIYDHMSVLSDGGGIYTNGITGTSLATGEHITGNLIHDNKAPQATASTPTTAPATSPSPATPNTTSTPTCGAATTPTTPSTTAPTIRWTSSTTTGPTGPADQNSKSVLIANNTNITSPSQIPAGHHQRGRYPEPLLQHPQLDSRRIIGVATSPPIRSATSPMWSMSTG